MLDVRLSPLPNLQLKLPNLPDQLEIPAIRRDKLGPVCPRRHCDQQIQVQIQPALASLSLAVVNIDPALQRPARLEFHIALRPKKQAFLHRGRIELFICIELLQHGRIFRKLEHTSEDPRGRCPIELRSRVCAEINERPVDEPFPYGAQLSNRRRNLLRRVFRPQSSVGE